MPKKSTKPETATDELTLPRSEQALQAVYEAATKAGKGQTLADHLDMFATTRERDVSHPDVYANQARAIAKGLHMLITQISKTPHARAAQIEADNDTRLAAQLLAENKAKTTKKAQK